MKKVLLLLISIFILSSCSANMENDNLEETSVISILEKNNDSVVLVYNRNKIIFYEICEEEQQGVNSLTLYEYDVLSGKIKQLGEVSDFYMSTNSAVIMNEGIVFTTCSQQDNKLVNKVYYAIDNNLCDIHNWYTNIPMSYLEKISDEELLIFYPDLIEEGNDEFYFYEILKLNVNNNEKTKIGSFSYNINKQEGEVVPTVDVYNDLIYVFKNSVREGENSYSICSLNLEGNIVNEYLVDIDDFLYLEEVSSYDSIYRIECMDEELFALQTLNNRIILFKKVNDKMVRVNIPEMLSAFPEGYKIVKNYEGDGSDIYFVDMFNDNIIKLDVASKMFSELNISEKFNISGVSSLNINSDGEILVKADEHAYIMREDDYKVLMDYSIQEFAQENMAEEKDDKEETLYKFNSEVTSITEQKYEKNGSFIEFSDLPENDAETIACHDLLGQIMDSSSAGECAKEWIKVEDIDTLAVEELMECDDYHILFEQLWMKLAPGVTYDYYVKTILSNGCVVVSLKYADKYTEEMNLKLPQLSDGEHEEFWLFVPNDDMCLEVFDNTRYYGAFNVYKEDVPRALYVKAEE